MTYRTFAEQKPAKQLAWLTGDTVLFQRGDTLETSVVHRNLLLARCPSANFKTTLRFNGDFWSTHLENDDETSFSHFLLWIYCDKVAPLTEDWESEYVSAFEFAQKYHLDEFEMFLEDKFASSAASYYGSGDNSGVVHNPTIATLITAVTILRKDSKISEFLLEQFLRSWIWRRAYSDKEFDDLVDAHPNVAKLLFRRTQDVVRMDPDNAVATFGLCGFKSPVHDDVQAEDGAVVVADERPADMLESVPGVSPTIEESEPAVEPAIEEEPIAQAVKLSPLLHKKPNEAPPAGYEYEMVRKKGKKRWRLVPKGEGSGNEPTTEELTPVEAPFEDAAAEADPELETYKTVEAEPGPATETFEVFEEPAVAVPEVAESSGDEPVSSSPARDWWGTEKTWGSAKGTARAY